MPGWLIGAVRTALQAGWGYLAAWLIAHNIVVPDQVPEPLVLVVLALVAGAVAGLIQWAERRQGSNVVARLVKAIARILMLGARQAEYPRPLPESARSAGLGGAPLRR